MDIATGAIGSILSKLAELLKAEYKLQTGVKKQVESLARELTSAHAFLGEIDKVPPYQLNEQVKSWASEVREASYHMDDVLDTFLVRVMGAKPIKKNKLKRLQEKMASFLSKTKARHDIASAIEEVNRNVRDIDERRRRYRLDDHVVSPTTPSSSIDPRIAAVHGTKAPLLIGIDERKDAVVKMLSRDDGMSAKKTKVVSLVGFGGVGKTTLAKATYDHLKQEYDCGAFVSVGQKPDLAKVFKDILFHLDKNKYKEIHSTQRGADLLIPELLEFLGDKRYLIVIDDVWEEESRKRITDALNDNDIGSRIIITTRNLEVAVGEIYRLQPLSDDDSRELLYARIFGGEDRCCDNKQQKVSKVADDKILRKCGGVPLAIITMASYLVGKSMEEWLKVCNSIGFCGKDKDQASDTMWILSLSYYDLPSHLKTCLLYLSVFPEDYLIRKDDLIWMWIAEGFVISEKPGAGLFEIGEGYFNELINRSLIQPVEEEESMTVEGCRVHDMILDLTRSLSREANFATVLGNGEEIPVGSDTRRLALQNRVVEDTPRDNCMDTKRARSLIAFRCRFMPRVHTRSFKLLHVLYLVGCHLQQLDEHVGDLHHLRCLGICESYLFLEIPEEIGALKFLQVLDLSDVPGILPSSVGMLTQLVCLRATGMRLPEGILKDLTSLQELRIRYRGEDEKSVGQFVKDLRNLSELRVLVVDIAQMGERMQSDLLTSAGNLQKLQHLGLEGGSPTGLPSCIRLSTFPNLSHLSLSLVSMCDQDLEILGALPELYYLRLSTFRRAILAAGTTPRGYFQKLRSCLLPNSTVQFVVNEEDSSVSFTMWHKSHDAPAFGPKRKQDSSCCRVAARAVMPNLEALLFQVDVMELAACKNGSCDNLGLEHLASLQKVMVIFDRRRVDEDVEKGEAALRHAIQAHPNRPTLEIGYW